MRLIATAIIIAAGLGCTNAADIIPLPVDYRPLKGHLTLASPTPVTASNLSHNELKRLATVHNLTEAQNARGGIALQITDSIAGTDSPEAYHLTVTADSATIAATTPEGLFRGLTTLVSMKNGNNQIESVEIIDYPRFSYRGLMLDISRHFRDKDFIKKQIDAMAALKLNNLHLHLTDAAGWRIEIDRYPELTEYAAWRPQETWQQWNEGGNKYVHRSDSAAHGGFLTKADAREIVEYAAERYINVIPEIEMPSHSEEVTATYPQLSCTHAPQGQPDFCVGNDSTFIFLQNVLDEVMDVFPSKVIHIGGDEASKRAWKECELCQSRMEKEGLKDVNELQSYLITRIEKYINSKGRRLLGWDEIMEGGLAPNAEVMSWRGIEGGIAAAASGHDAIMTPGGFCYLDSYQDAPASQPEAIGGYLPLERVYSYNPVPDTLAIEIRPYIKGVQGNLWCEYVPTASHAEYMLYPRMFAIAEIGWTPQSKRSFNSFRKRAEVLADTMRKMGYTVFDITKEVGNKPEAQRQEQHIALGKPVKYNIPWWRNYPSSRESALTDGIRGGWNYSDGLWQGFLSRGDNRMDITVDMETETKISFISAEFMQLTGPGVWFPTTVEISVSNDGINFTSLTTINHTQQQSKGVSFKEYSWQGETRARYVRYVAKATNGVLFTDEVIIR